MTQEKEDRGRQEYQIISDSDKTVKTRQVSVTLTLVASILAARCITFSSPIRRMLTGLAHEISHLSLTPLKYCRKGVVSKYKGQYFPSYYQPLSC